MSPLAVGMVIAMAPLMALCAFAMTADTDWIVNLRGMTRVIVTELTIVMAMGNVLIMMMD